MIMTVGGEFRSRATQTCSVMLCDEGPFPPKEPGSVGHTLALTLVSLCSTLTAGRLFSLPLLFASLSPPHSPSL